MIARDKRYVWHPYTQHGTEGDPIVIARAKAASLFDSGGREILDLISSWWTCTHGHSHPKLNAALAAQASRFEHVMFAGFTHEPAADLAASLAKILPGDLNKVFFSDDGSTSVEVALKIAYQYWINRDEPRRRGLIAFDGGYHGDTLGAMSLGRGSKFFTPFRDLMCEVSVLPYPGTFEGDDAAGEREAGALSALEATLTDRRTGIAALIVEPLLQGAGGMRVCRPEFLKRLVKTARDAGVLVIFDEVATGFGRTGSMFAMEQAKVVPDLVCLSKGLTAGYMPMAVDGGARSAVRGLRRRKLRARAAPRPFLYGKSARLRRGARFACVVRGREDAATDRAHQPVASRLHGRACGAPRRDAAAPPRLDPRLRRERGGRLSIGGQPAAVRAGISRTASISGRSARRFISCRPIASPRRSLRAPMPASSKASMRSLRTLRAGHRRCAK